MHSTIMYLDGHNLSALFEGTDGLISFAEDSRKYIPDKGSIIYTVWDGSDTFIYVGISGLQKSEARRNPQTRIVSHASGRRSGDQFCIYVYDFFVVPELIKCGEFTPKKGELDALTKKYIRANLWYRFLAFESVDSDQVVRKLVKRVQAGACGSKKPLFNYIQR